MKKVGLLLVGAASLSLGVASAYSPVQQSVEEYFEESEHVAYVRIESGVVHRIDGEQCDVRYKVDVLMKFKGDLPSEATIGRGLSFSAAEVGKHYLVFLSTRHGFDRREMVQFINMPEEFLSKCRTDEVYLEPRIMIGESFDGGTASFVVPTRIVDFPERMKSGSEVSVLGNMSVIEPVYVSREEAFEYLRELGKTKSAN